MAVHYLIIWLIGIGAQNSSKWIMKTQSEYPRVLICMCIRVNADDTVNNNLLLRGLFGDWPRDRIAQIRTGVPSEEESFCGREYCISAEDRRFGPLKAWLTRTFKKDSDDTKTVDPGAAESGCPSRPANSVISRFGRFITESGLCEILFPVRPSKAMLEWIDDFSPDVIFAQGYDLTFSWLPVQLKRKLHLPIAFFTSDDWPSYLYADKSGLLRITSPFLRRLVGRATRELLADTDYPFAFNQMMAAEYLKRYGKEFMTIMHSDDPDRFRQAEPIRLCPDEVKSIIAAGGFDQYRWPLLLDIEEACRRLTEEGLQVRVTVLTSRIVPEGYERLQECKFVEVRSDPGHNLLPSYLKGADALFLPETFDENQAEAIKYSISTKAHLFMLAQRPILVYGSPETGLVTYAQQEGWAHAVCERDVSEMKSAIKKLLTDDEYAAKLVTTAAEVFQRNHDSRMVREKFLNGMRPCEKTDIIQNAC